MLGRSLKRAYGIQKHAARALHYDLRLELDGVLLSWAVPKGPSLATTDRRLAVRVGDHALEHLDFEGRNVIVWDRGTWEPEGDPHEGVARGKLVFVVSGQKLNGKYRLVRFPSDATNWMLIKGKDEHARRGSEADITERKPVSVLTGRTLDGRSRDPE